MKKIPLLLLLLCLLPLTVRADSPPFQDGDSIVIYDPSTGKALSALQSGSYNTSTSVTLTDGILTGYSDAEVWQVSASEGGTWRLENSGLALSLGESYSYLRLGDIHDRWALESAGTGLYQLRNTGRNMVLVMNPRRYLWSATTPGNTSAGTSAFAIYVLPRAEEPPVLEMPEGYQLYFGLLHSHSNLSDGLSSVEDTFLLASEAPQMDFFAITDHSHAFDTSREPSLTADATDYSQAWAAGKEAAQAATTGDFVGLFGFEMGWNQEQGHISTFHTPGFLSRDQAEYESYATGLEAYYDALLDAPGSVSQFNHPGEFGTFKNFAAYTPALDQRMTLLELSDSTEYYDQALSLGWHLGPTAGTDLRNPAQLPATAARTVILAERLTEEALLDALANRRVYATEDRDLQILFTLNGAPIGSRLPRSETGSTVELHCQLYDPTDGQLGILEIVTDTGQVVESLELTQAHCAATIHLSAGRDYYYLRLTQPDGDLAVTAPIWLDDRDRMGITALEPAAKLATAGVLQEIQVTISNNEPEELTVTAISLTLEGQTYHTEQAIILPPYSSASHSFSHTFSLDGVYDLRAAAQGSYAGESRQFSFHRELVVMPQTLVEPVYIDCSHGTADTFQQISALAARQDLDMQILANPPGAEQLDACSLLVIPAPEQLPDEAYLSVICDYVNYGGSLLLCGASPEGSPQSLAFFNDLLEILNISARFLPEIPWDAVENGDAPSQIRTAIFSDSPWMTGLAAGQYYIQEGGCTIAPGAGQWLVKTANNQVLLSVEDTGQGGQIFLAGSSFLADSNLPPQSDSAWVQPSANQTLAENILGLLRSSQARIPISDLRSAEPGRIYLAEGRVTAGTANPNTTFPNTIYIQDDTGGIAVTDYSTPGLPLGARVQILGVLDWAAENPLLKCLRLTVLTQESPLVPTAAQPSDRVAGELIQVEGTVTDFDSLGRAVSRFTLSDGANTVEIRIEDAIQSGSLGYNNLARIIQTGNRIRAVGICFWSGESWILRVRDCDEIRLLAGLPGEDAPLPEEPSDPATPTDPSETAPTTPGEAPDEPTEDPELPDYDPGDGGSDFPVNPDTGDRMLLWVLLLGFSALGLRNLRKRA